jgi:hypothetical protein
MKLTTILVAAALIIMSVQGCATVVQKQLVPTGGSRADGTVKLSYEYSRFEIPKVDKQQGLIAAKQRCASWGYTGAEAFGGFTRACLIQSGRSCMRWLVSVEYQCTGTGTPDASKE